MSKYVLTLAVLAAACVPTVASAEDAQDTQIQATQLSDAEMDQVTAGYRPDWTLNGRPSWAGLGKPAFAGQGKPSWAGKPLIQGKPSFAGKPL